MSFAVTATVIGAGATIYSANKSSNAASDAASAQRQSVLDSNQLQQDQFNQSAEFQRPWRDAGANALGQIQNRLTAQEWSQPFGMSQFQADPGYQFRMNEGQKALDRRQLAGGRFFSAGGMKDLSRWNQDAASQEYGNAFNRFQTDRSNRLNPLMQLAGVGQTSSAQTGQNAMALGQSMGNNLVNTGDATAAGIVGSNNAQNRGFNSLYGFLNSKPWQGAGNTFNASQPSVVGWNGGAFNPDN